MPEDEVDSWAWWRRDSGTGEYTGLDTGFETIATAIKDAGGIDGVIGFSQGAAATGFVASLLEAGRIEAFAAAAKSGEPALPYPSSFLDPSSETGTINPPLKFAVSYCGFFAPHGMYRSFYEPKIATPMLNVIGTVDSVVEESRTLEFVKACETERVVYHPGGHFVPIGKEMAGALVGFLRECCTETVEEKGFDDLDMPF